MGAKLSKHKRLKKIYQGGTYTLNNSEPRRHSQTEAKVALKGRFFKPKEEKLGKGVEHTYSKRYTTDAYDNRADNAQSMSHGHDVSSLDKPTQVWNTTTTTQPNSKIYPPSPSPSVLAPKTSSTPKLPSTTPPALIEPAQQPPPVSFARKKQEPLIVNGQRFYRPGEAGHPAYKATSKEWMRCHGMGQNALVKRRVKAYTTTTTIVATNATVTNTVEVPAPGPPELGNEGVIDPTKILRVPLDNVLDAETYGGVFHPRDVALDEKEGLGENASQGPRKMKYYRPGDPNHQAVRPTTEEFRRKYSALNSFKPAATRARPV